MTSADHIIHAEILWQYRGCPQIFLHFLFRKFLQRCSSQIGCRFSPICYRLEYVSLNRCIRWSSPQYSLQFCVHGMNPDLPIIPSMSAVKAISWVRNRTIIEDRFCWKVGPINNLSFKDCTIVFVAVASKTTLRRMRCYRVWIPGDEAGRMFRCLLSIIYNTSCICPCTSYFFMTSA